MATFDDTVRTLLDAPNFAVVATLTASGAPHTSTDIRGTAELVDDPKKTLPARLAKRYLGDAAANPGEPAGSPPRK
jgi:hypothetical protein